MKITQSQLRKVIQEEIEKVREAPTSDIEELHNRAMDQLDGVMKMLGASEAVEAMEDYLGDDFMGLLEDIVRKMSQTDGLEVFDKLSKLANEERDRQAQDDIQHQQDAMLGLGPYATDDDD